MKLLGWTAVLWAVSTAAADPPPKRRLALDDLDRLRQVSDARISPDGGWVAYVVESANLEQDERTSDVWMASWDGRRQLQLTHTPKQSESAPRWSPDGLWLAMLADRGGEDAPTQVWLMSRAGGEAQQLTALEGEVSEFAWSPDSRRLALIAADPPEAGKGKKPARPPIVIDRYQFKQDEIGYLGTRRSHLYVFDVESRRAELITPGTSDERFPAWSPDGTRIAFVSKRGGDPDRHWNWDVFVIEAKPGATPRAVTTFEGDDSGPDFESPLAFSPDGATLAYVRAVDAGWEQRFYGGPTLGLVAVAGGDPKLPLLGLDRQVRQPRWSPDGRSVYYLLEDDRSVIPARIAAAGGPPERLLRLPIVVQDFDVGRDGRIAVTAGRGQQPFEVYALEAGALRPLSSQNTALLASLELGAVREMDFNSADGTRIGAMLTTPPEMDASRRHPTIALIHGGPVSQDQNEFDARAQWLAANGYVVVRPNYRGSSGRGFAFSRAIAHDWGHLEVQDVLAAVDALVARGLADPGRLGIGGWSYGAMTTNYTIASDTRFKAAIAGAGIANQITGYGTDEYVTWWESELGPPWKGIDAYLKVSYPFFHADRIVTPTLFMCGEQDFNVPLVNSEQMYQALRSLGRDTQLVIYPDEHHVFTRPSHLRDRERRWLEWFDSHLKQ